MSAPSAVNRRFWIVTQFAACRKTMLFVWLAIVARPAP
jgi:hypothetical protein